MGVLSGSFGNKNSGGGVISKLKKEGLIDTSDTEREVALRQKQQPQTLSPNAIDSLKGLMGTKPVPVQPKTLTPTQDYALKGLMGTNKPMSISNVQSWVNQPFDVMANFGQIEKPYVPPHRTAIDDIAEKYVAGVGSFGNSATLGLLPTMQKIQDSTNPFKQSPSVYDRTQEAISKQPVASTIGNIAGYLVPGTGITKALGATSLGAKLLPKAGDAFIKSIGKGALTGALENTAMGGIEGSLESARDNKPLLPTLVNRLGKDALIGGAFGGVLGAIGKGLNLLKSNKELPINNINKPQPQATESILKPVNTLGNINSPLDNVKSVKTQNTMSNIGKDVNVGSKPINFDAIKTIDDLPKDEAGLKQFVQETEKQIKNGLVLPEMNLQLFAEAQRRLKQRKFASNSIMNAEVVPAEMKQTIADNMPEYEPITNKETWKGATNKVNSDLKSSIDEWKSLDSVKSADDTALGQALMVDAIKKGDVSTANEIAYELAEKLTKAGQTVQAASILKRLSPEGMLTHVNRTLQKAERELGDKFKGKLKLTDDEAKEIADRMKKMKEMADGREKDVEFAKIQKLVSDKIPPTIREKLKALQRINLLLNPKTMIRNVGGNLIGSALANTKDVLKTGLDKGISKVFGTERTSLLPSLTTQAKGGYKGFKNTIQDAKMGIDTSNVSGQFEINTQRMGSPFKSKLFRKADELTRTGLRLGDSPFYQATYDDVLRQQMKIKGVKEATPEMKLMAENEAKVRTWQDTNKYTEFFDSIRNGLNKVGVKGFGLGDVVLPFTKTPANILKAGVEYSPLNIINVANNAVKFAKSKGSLDQYKLVDSLAKTLTGTGLLGAGIYFAQKGLITSKAPTDYDASSFQKEQGVLPYALKVGDKFISFDWAQPASIPIAMGADIYNNYKNSKNPQGAVIDGVKGGLGTLFSQSMVQGLQKLFSSFDSSGNGLMDNLENAGYNSILQLLPFNSLTRQIAEVKDPFNRSTYEDTSLESKLTNQAKRSLPILRETLPQKFKTTGEAEASRGWFNTLLNPANVGTPNLDTTKNEILRLYNESGQKIQFPRIASKTITPIKKGKTTFEKIPLDGKQRSEYQKMLGEETMKSFNKIISQPKYNKLNDEDKANKLQDTITNVDKLVKKNLIKNLQLPLKPKK